jgi:lipoprotein-anchoring transpeptidase ErfK/SrfK
MTILKRVSFALLLLGLIIITASEVAAVTKSKKSSRPLSKAELKSARQRLKELGYVSAGGNTQSALTLFQKWEGRKVTGRLNRGDFDELMNASAPKPKDPDYKHVEVDLDRQLLLLIDHDGAIARMLPVSTGSGKRYNEKGMRGTAYTPRGRFRIYGKIAGWRKSPLGLLYYPNYFSDGLAIHGNPSVPSTPQSHGCIRIPMSAAREISRQLSVGTIVLIYDSESFVSARDWVEEDKRKQAATIQ